MHTKKKNFIITVVSFGSLVVKSQPVPAQDENIPFLMTFGPKAETSWGDDDFSQTFFFQIPESYKGVIYIKVFDPNIGGMSLIQFTEASVVLLMMKPKK